MTGFAFETDSTGLRDTLNKYKNYYAGIIALLIYLKAYYFKMYFMCQKIMSLLGQIYR